MKILFVYPVPPKAYWPKGLFRSQWVPSGIAYIGRALIDAGHEVRIHMREERLVKCSMDWNHADAELRNELAEFKPDIVGLSILTPSMPEAGWIAEQAKATCGPDTIVVAGGVHPSALPEETLRDYIAIDVVAVGEGEKTLVELAEKGVSPDIAGLVYRDKDKSAISPADKFIHTAKRDTVKDLDSLGFPAYELFDMAYYSEPAPWAIRWLPLSIANIRTSRGCPGACRFCAGHKIGGIGVRYHSIEHVIEQIDMVVRNFGVEAIHFEDDTMGSDIARLQALCRELRKRGFDKLKWDCCLRVDQVDAELLKEMKSSGCIQIEYGFESGSDATLKRLSKNTSVELNRRAVNLMRKAGIRIFADVMFGLPGETEEQFKATIKFLRWARPEIISATCLCPLPGSSIYNELPEETKQNIEWGQYAYLEEVGMNVNLTAMSAERLRKLYQRFRRYIHQPYILYSFLRDTPAEYRYNIRRSFAKKYRRFLLHHPIAAVRLPN